VFFLLGAFLLYELLTIPFITILSLNSTNPTQTALMRQRMREAAAEEKPLKIVQTWIPLSRVPSYVLDAIVVAEDGTFYEHGGIDWFEVQESIEKNLDEGRAARGASTITQQLAKNLFLSTSKDPVRKLREAAITLLMEQTLSKRRILELYVNLIEWGRGVFGIEAASRAFFGKSASGLTLDEGTRLAAVIPSPLRHRPDANSRYVLRRKAIVLGRMSARRQIPATTEEEEQSRSPEQAPVGDSPAVPLPEEAPVAPDTSATDQGH
jgi:monofunctional biosynthetic peptidoglycan transglycosylase